MQVSQPSALSHAVQGCRRALLQRRVLPFGSSGFDDGGCAATRKRTETSLHPQHQAQEAGRAAESAFWPRGILQQRGDMHPPRSFGVLAEGSDWRTAEQLVNASFGPLSTVACSASPLRGPDERIQLFGTPPAVAPLSSPSGHDVDEQHTTNASGNPQELSELQKKLLRRRADQMAKLNRIQEIIADRLPHFFDRRFTFEVFAENIVLTDSFWGLKAKGLGRFKVLVSALRSGGPVLYTDLCVDVIKITVHGHDSTIRVRWRVKGRPRSFLSRAYTVFDVFMICKINGEGLIDYICISQFMPRDDPEYEKDTPALRIAAGCP